MQITPADKALAAGFAGQLEPTFKVAGETFTRADMLAANVDDAATCAWLATAKAGDVLEQMHAERVECVPATQRKRQFVVTVIRGGQRLISTPPTGDRRDDAS